MSTILMFRKCQHCGHRYTYNPSTGNLGLICPRCNKAQSSILPVPQASLEDVVKDKLKEWATKTVDAFLIHSQVPEIGSVLYCNLALAFEHTGIYVGDGQVVHLNGDGIIEKVSYKEFIGRFDGSNPSCSIFCATNGSGKSIGSRQVAERALRMLGCHQHYNLLFDNCHCFTSYCLTGVKPKVGSFIIVTKILRSRFGFACWRAINIE